MPASGISVRLASTILNWTVMIILGVLLLLVLLSGFGLIGPSSE